MAVVDKLTKFSHFISIKVVNKVENYMKEIARLHGIPKAIVSDKDSKFTSNFWKGFFKEFRTNLNLSIAYHL